MSRNPSAAGASAPRLRPEAGTATAGATGWLLPSVLGFLAGLASLGSAGTAVVLPSLASDLGITPGTSAWVISGFSLTYGVAMAVHGRLADLFGLRLPLVAGTTLMAAGATIAATASDIGVLLLGRLLQGAGGAAIPVLGMAVVSATYSGLRRDKALALATGISAAGACSGPLVGGLLDAALSWRASIVVPGIGLALVPLIWRRIPTRGTGGGFDVLGAVLVTACATGVVLLVQSAATEPVLAVAGVVLLAVGVPCAVRRVRRVPDGFLPRAVVTNGIVVRVALAATAVPIAWFALLVAVPTDLSAQGWEPLHIGLALLPSVVFGLVAPRLAAPLLIGLGSARSLVLTGLVSGVALAVASLGIAATVPALLVLGVVLVTTAFGLCQPAMVAAINAAVTSEVRGVALGIAIMTFFVAGGIGSAVIGGFGELAGLAACLGYLAATSVVVASLAWPLTRRPLGAVA